ncbi:winged helix-turn-helix domain-containing protein [Pseudoxanthomonas sp. 10H]|uniref:winged helix-turn-helix domain-containing protein n=1 Tax=Pseudoxanthomonas sp. 10H TaxID=3242729 RepID=UPI003555EB47
MSEQPAIGRIDDPGAPRGGPSNFTAGEALVQPPLNRIAIHGRVVQVEPKVMQVLVLMAQRPGAVISRETFLDTVWAGTIADDYLLNRAVSELRKVFDDDPQAPRYIETIRKGGYRLVAPIAPARVAAAVAAPTPDAAAAPAATPPEATVGGHASPATTHRRRRWLAGAALVPAVVATVLAPRLLPRDGGLAEGYEVRPLTSLVGREFEPALSPDGSRVAFIWDGGEGGGFDVQVKTLGSEDLLPLTRTAAHEHHPVWAADGRSLLFARLDQDGVSIMRVSALGGGETRVLRDDTARQVRGLALSPDGAGLAYAARSDPASPYRIVLATSNGAGRRVATTPPAGTLGDLDPRFTPDGQALVFVRAVNEVTKDLHRIELDAPAETPPRRLTRDNRKINGLAWSPDGSRLLFTSTRSGMYALWSADADGGDLRPVPLGNEDVHQPATAAGIPAIAFEQWTHRSRLRQVDLARPDASGPDLRIQSTRWDSNPAWSPDGRRIAFTSNRGGPHGIWVSDRDGGNAVQVAGFDGAFIDNPAWSPDGRVIAFDGSPDGTTAIYAVTPEGGTPERLVHGPGDSRNPSWSRDGQWLYFESNRDGQWRIHAVPAAGGRPVAVTDGPAAHPRESADGRQLLYTRPDHPGLWQLPRRDWHRAGAGSGTPVIAGLEPQDGGNWAPGTDGIYFVRRAPGQAPQLARLGLEDGATRDLLALPADFQGWGFDLSPDQRQLVFSELAMRESDLRLAVPR